MICKKCNGNNVTVQVGSKNSAIWNIVKWGLVLATGGIWLLVMLAFGFKKKKVMHICQDCGYIW